MAASKKPRGILISGNWKMNHGVAEVRAFFSQLAQGYEKHRDELEGAFKGGQLAAGVFPTALTLQDAHHQAGTLPFSLFVGSQNTHWEKKGAFTGEISAPMLQEIGVHWTLVGHSERRQFFGETDETARKRTESLLAQDLRVMLCIGETRAEREAGRTLEVITRQLYAVLTEVGVGAAKYLDGTLVLAYEPVWAIGTGLTATPAQAEEAHHQVRKLLWDRFGMDAAARTPILYGGSVTPENVDSLLACPNVDGALVGGASLKAESFLALLRSGAKS